MYLLYWSMFEVHVDKNILYTISATRIQLMAFCIYIYTIWAPWLLDYWKYFTWPGRYKLRQHWKLKLSASSFGPSSSSVDLLGQSASNQLASQYCELLCLDPVPLFFSGLQLLCRFGRCSILLHEGKPLCLFFYFLVQTHCQIRLRKERVPIIVSRILWIFPDPVAIGGIKGL